MLRDSDEECPVTLCGLDLNSVDCTSERVLLVSGVVGGCKNALVAWDSRDLDGPPESKDIEQRMGIS